MKTLVYLLSRKKILSFIYSFILVYRIKYNTVKGLFFFVYTLLLCGISVYNINMDSLSSTPTRSLIRQAMFSQTRLARGCQLALLLTNLYRR